ncbi:DUF4376 domain-containing protein [Chelatococcus sp. XZ-Ab1]|uniref:DUF4376 domain-containing protein n=1 Tax=Chelatococcus sp. XZ-Ab1 TaxID=3034027 RepID=UPI0023E4428C|nr:DUF4376 domain-containing protein [Chelatococcus sp. XZ-Ab1]
MALALLKNGVWKRWDGWLDQVQHNIMAVEHCWSSAELADAGLAVIQPAIIPPGKVAVGEPSLVDDDGIPRESFELEDAPQPEPPTLAEYAARRRWQVEIGGTTWSGWPIHTDRGSQSKITSEAFAALAGLREEPAPWKFADGQFRPLSNADVIDMAQAARNHVVASFGIEAEILAGIAAGTITTTEQIDAAFAGF